METLTAWLFWLRSTRGFLQNQLPEVWLVYKDWATSWRSPSTLYTSHTSGREVGFFFDNLRVFKTKVLSSLNLPLNLREFLLQCDPTLHPTFHTYTPSYFCCLVHQGIFCWFAVFICEWFKLNCWRLLLLLLLHCWIC